MATRISRAFSSSSSEAQRDALEKRVAFFLQALPPLRFIGHTIYGYWAYDGTLLAAHERRT